MALRYESLEVRDPMTRLPDFSNNFSRFYVHEGIYKASGREINILIESRKNSSGEELIYSKYDDEEIRAASIYEFVSKLPSLESLQIAHTIRIKWHDELKRVKLHEIFTPAIRTSTVPPISLQLEVKIDSKSYKTQPCDTLLDAKQELAETTKEEAKLQICTCITCDYSGQAEDYLMDDREYWCYRDFPEAYDEIRKKRMQRKRASGEAKYSGVFYVSWFHTCAAWRPRVSFPTTR